MPMMEIAGLKHSKTKQLARELGLLPAKRKAAVSGNGGGLTKRRKGQLLTYLIVIDFESTCWKDKKGMQEIIEFPAVLLDMSCGRVASEFHHYVGPTEYPVLSAFCKELTGISQTQVDNGIPLPTCLYLFKQWICKLREEMGVVLMEPGHTYSDKDMLCALVTWSDWDLEVCLSHECSRKQIRKQVSFSQWINIRAVYKSFYERKPCGLNGALEDLGIKFIGRQHSGIDDAKNTARLCYRMIRDGCRLTITKCIHNQLISQIKPPPSLDTPPSTLTRKPLSGTSSNIEHATPEAPNVEELAENSVKLKHPSPKAPEVKELAENSSELKHPSLKAPKVKELAENTAKLKHSSPKAKELAENTAKRTSPGAPRVKELVENTIKLTHPSPEASKVEKLTKNSFTDTPIISEPAPSKEAAKSGCSMLARSPGLMESNSVDDWGDVGGELFCEVTEEWEKEMGELESMRDHGARNRPLKRHDHLHLCGASEADSLRFNVRSTLVPDISLKLNLPHPFHRCGSSHRTSESSTSAPAASESPVSIHASSHPYTASRTASVWPSSKTPVKSQLVTHIAPVTLLSPASSKSCVPGSSGLPGPLKGFYGASKESNAASPSPLVREGKGYQQHKRYLCRGTGAGGSPSLSPAMEPLNADEQVTPCSSGGGGGGGGGGGSLANHQSPNVIEETPPAEQGNTGRDSSLFAVKGSVSTTSSPSSPGFKTPSTTSWLKSKQAFSPNNWSNVSPLSSSFLFASGGKITPPLCGCGRRAKRKVVCSPGPNEGKPFYVCPCSRGNDRKQGCNYFKWENRTADSPSNAKPLLSDYGERRYS